MTGLDCYTGKKRTTNIQSNKIIYTYALMTIHTVKQYICSARKKDMRLMQQEIGNNYFSLVQQNNDFKWFTTRHVLQSTTQR